MRSLCVCLIFALSAACRMGPSSVVYQVGGSASKASVTYTTPDGDIEQVSGASLPWSRSFSAHSGDFLSLSAQNDGATGCVQVKILKKEAVLKDAQSCGAFVIASTSTTY